MNFKKFPIILLLLSLLFILPSCSKKADGPKPDIEGKTIHMPETSMKIGVSPGEIKLPTVSEIKWDFYKVPNNQKYECRMQMKVKFNGDEKFLAQIQLLDYNNFPVTIQQEKLIGQTGEETEYQIILYIEPELSKKITKAKVILDLL